MANGFGSLYVGAAAIRTSQTALDITANNLVNINTDGYVREQVLFTDDTYSFFQSAAISDQMKGTGVKIADVIHTRDMFLDKAFRSENSRHAFYAASYDAVTEVETFLQEATGEAFSEALNDFYVAFQEFSKDPSDTVNQNLVVQKASLFLTREQNLYQGLSSYQSTINTKIKDDVNRINELAEQIHDLNLKIERIEAGKTETAMDLRDQRDYAVDELSKLANITCTETIEGVYHIKLEEKDFIDDFNIYPMGLYTDTVTGFVTPYWPHLSAIEGDPATDDVYPVYDLTNISAAHNTDKGEVKALLLARGDSRATWYDMDGLSQEEYEIGLANSVMMNSEAELDTLTHEIITSINDIFSPLTTYEGATVTGTDAKGNTVTITAGTKIADTENCAVGSDGQIPPRELFIRRGCDRYTEVTLDDGSKMYVYNEEDTSDVTKCYTTRALEVNQDLIQNRTLLSHMTQNDAIDYDLGKNLIGIWEDASYTLNPSDQTPCTYTGFYTKYIGELADVGSIYKTTSQSLDNTSQTIDNNRQAVIGVSSDEELTNMIKYQQAYNAASRYVNVLSQMIEHLLSALG
ncbi:MAG: flagellar hook-associated protein FlgK [Lachnospiraceae bacterium]|nr:flagellar hook-associated protein FlgK [Lachnospiraceae bacterium]